MADFDVIRDRTLLFFLDHLMGKGQPRSLHDLSCQFGAKGFTKEMRQIAGGSQAGLKKFLSQFPSLFTIDGDNVCNFFYFFKFIKLKFFSGITGSDNSADKSTEWFL